MLSANTSQQLDKPGVSDEEKHRKHAEAQCKYRERNLEATQKKARERMSYLRKNTKPSKMRLQRRERRGRDAENREVVRKKKFIAEFGEDAFYDDYIPQLQQLGVDELPGFARQYRKEMANGLDAQKEEGGDAGSRRKKK